MLIDIVLLAVGLLILYYGAEFLVEGGSGLALERGVSPLIVGLTVVAIGTSLPELLVSLSAALRGTPDIAVGNVVGSNTANIGLIVGLAALIYPVAVDRSLLRRDVPFMFLLYAAGALFMVTGAVVGRGEGLALMALQAVFLLMCLRAAKAQSRYLRESDAPAPERHTARHIARVLGGLVGLGIGAELMVTNAVDIASALGVSELVIGLTIVAVGTSLPELATSVIAALKKQPEICLGNVVGSNIFNTGFVLASTAVVMPVPVSPAVIRLDLPVMVAVAVLLVPMLLRGTVSRIAGAVLMASYAAYVVVLTTGAGASA